MASTNKGKAVEQDDPQQLKKDIAKQQFRKQQLQMTAAANREEIQRLEFNRLLRAENQDIQLLEPTTKKGRKRLPSTDRNDNEHSDYNVSDESDDSDGASSKTSQYNTESDDCDDAGAGKGTGAKQGKGLADQMANRENKTKNMTANDQAMVKKNNATINKHINQSLSHKVEDLIQVFQKDFSLVRPYCNKVMVKVARTELLQIDNNKQAVYLEQEFKLTKETNFETLKDMCCHFWGLNEDKYSLYDSKFGHLMALNSDEHHPAHTVSDYFEVLKIRYPSLFLLKDELDRNELFKNREQKLSAVINSSGGGSGGAKDQMFDSEQTRKKQEDEMMQRNFKIFNRTFPGQRKYQLDKEKRSTRVDISLLPDTYFLTFLVNVLQIIATLIFFFNTRDIAEEYFIRKNVVNVFEKDNLRLINTDDKSFIDQKLQPFSSVISTETFYSFLTQTIPYSIFLDNDSSLLAFSSQNPPIGQLQIRTQHLEIPLCEQNPIISTDKENTCETSSGEQTFLTEPISMLGDDKLAWKSAADNGIEITLYDDDFSNPIDGSGYIYNLDYRMTPAEAKSSLEDLFTKTDFFRLSTLQVSILNLVFYIPSHDMFVSLLMEIRFDTSGSVRTRSFEVLPFQIYTAGSSTHEEVVYRANLVTAFSVIRFICCIYTLFVVFLKIKYRKVIGEGDIWGSVFRDFIQIFLAVLPVIIGMQLQGMLNLDDLASSQADFHKLGRDAQFVQHFDGFFLLFMSFRIVNSFRIFPYMDWLVNVLNRTMGRIATFYLAVLPFFIVMIVVLYFVSGANVEETSTLVRSIFTIIRFALGIGNTSEYYPINQYFYYAWSLIFVFSLYYFLLPVSIALFLEAYEEITMELGHVTDYSTAQEKGQFKQWIMAMPPWKALQKKYKIMMDLKEKREKGLVGNEDDDSN